MNRRMLLVILLQVRFLSFGQFSKRRREAVDPVLNREFL